MRNIPEIHRPSFFMDRLIFRQNELLEKNRWCIITKGHNNRIYLQIVELKSKSFAFVLKIV